MKVKKRSLIGILCLVCVLILNITTVFAAEEEPTLEVKIPVSSNVDTAIIQIDGAAYLPTTTTITGSGEFVLNFNKVEPGDEYIYTISQSLDNPNYTVDDRVYTVHVYVLIDDELVYTTTIIDDGTENKPISCVFENQPKDSQPIPPSPPTGDDSNIGLWLGLMCGSAALTGILFFTMKKSLLRSED